MWTPKISSGAKRSLRTKSSLIPLKELKNGKRNNSQSQSLTPHPNPIENIKSDGFYYKQDIIEMLKSRGIFTSLRGDGVLASLSQSKSDKWTQDEFFKLVNSLPPRSRDLFERAARDDLAVVDWPTFTKNLTEMFEAAKKSKIEQKDSKTGVFHCSNGHKEECFIPDYIPQARFQVASFIQALLDGKMFMKTIISWKE